MTFLPCGMQVLTACLKSFAHGECYSATGSTTPQCQGSCRWTLCPNMYVL